MIPALVVAVRNTRNVMEKTNLLQQEGLELLKNTRLLEKLSEVGEVHLVGNMAFETTIKPDIDIQIYPKASFEETTTQILTILTALKVKEVVVRKLKISKKTLILGKYSFKENTWNVDIALTNKSYDYKYDSYQYYLDYHQDFTAEKRELIIQFKKELCSDRIIFDNPSYYIYRGVIEENIKTLEEMKQYLEKMKTLMNKGKKR